MPVTWPAATNASNPAPQPTSRTFSPGRSGPQGERVADAGEGLDGAAGERVDDGAGIAEELGQRPAGAEVEGASGLEGDVAVPAAYLAAQPACIDTVIAH